MAHTDFIFTRNLFWAAEVSDRSTVVAEGTLGFARPPKTKRFPTPAAAERAVHQEAAKRVRLGYRPIPDNELLALQRFVQKELVQKHYDYRLKDDFGAPSAHPVHAYVLQKFRRAKRSGRVVVTTSGDIGGTVESKTTTHRHDNAAALAIQKDTIAWSREGFAQHSLQELTALNRYATALNARASKRPALATTDLPAPAVAVAAPAPPAATIVPRRLPASAAAKVKRDGPFADTFTSPVVHFVELSPGKPSKLETATRATSGGRPIMAEGQSWPACGRCSAPLSLYLQFDVEPELGLGFLPGSHLLAFNCAACNAMAMTVPTKKLHKRWLSPDYPQTYRVILNRPAAREAIFPADTTSRERKVKLTSGAEKVTPLIEDVDPTPRGREGFKIGGLPHKLQPWTPPRCDCGAPLGFVFQVPLTDAPGWSFGLDTFIFACTKQCSPYATIVIPDR